MKLRYYIIRRLLLLIPLLLGITLLLFIITNVFINPETVYIHNLRQVAQIKALRAKYGLDQPLYLRYFTYLRNLVTGDWGTAVSDNNNPVTVSLATHFPPTIELTVAALLLTILLGIPTGIISATRKDRTADHVTRIIALSSISIAPFWLALMLQILFSYQFQGWGLPFLPSHGQYSNDFSVLHPIPPITGLSLVDTLLAGNGAAFLDAMAHLILPTLTIALLSFGVLTRIVRSSMLEVLRQDYITLARSKGLPERVVVYKHALRNAMMPTFTLLGLFLAGLLAGDFFAENIFAWPGIGYFTGIAIGANDFAAIMGVTLVTSIILVVANLVVDVFYAVIDPRVRIGE